MARPIRVSFAAVSSYGLTVKSTCRGMIHRVDPLGNVKGTYAPERGTLRAGKLECLTLFAPVDIVGSNGA